VRKLGRRDRTRRTRVCTDKKIRIPQRRSEEGNRHEALENKNRKKRIYHEDKKSTKKNNLGTVEGRKATGDGRRQ